MSANMHPCSPLRSFLHFFLFACATVLLGLTAYRIHYTKSLKSGDILTNRTGFYDPIIVELLVTSCLAILFSLWLGIAVLHPLGGPLGSFASEHFLMFVIWVMFLVGAAITTAHWDHLKWCRHGHKVCRILETIKAFSWICWIIATFIILASLVHKFHAKEPLTGTAAGTRNPTTRSPGYPNRDDNMREGGVPATITPIQNTGPNPAVAAV